MTLRANPGVHITVLVWGKFEGSFDIDGNGSVLYENDKNTPCQLDKMKLVPLSGTTLHLLALDDPWLKQVSKVLSCLID